jgi:hypothetical protein
MTVVTFVSVKGAPGVTTLSCLVGATWPDHRRVAVVEADPFGGDLAARFQLTTLRGWTSYAAAWRRSVESAPVDPHLQTLPGGLEVLVGARAEERVVSVPIVEALVEGSAGRGPDALDLIVDCGRMLFDGDDGTPADGVSGRVSSAPGVATWLDRSDLVVVVTRRDPPSILKVREREPLLTERCGERLRLVVVGRGPHDNAAIQEFTGLPVVGEVPFDIVAGQVASGGDGSSRHLSHSLLVVSARRLAEVVATPGGLTEAGERCHDRGNGTRSDSRPPAPNPVKFEAKTRGSLVTRIARFARVTGLARSRRLGRSLRSAMRRGREVREGPAPTGTLGAPQSRPPGSLDPEHAEQGALR